MSRIGHVQHERVNAILPRGEDVPADAIERSIAKGLLRHQYLGGFEAEERARGGGL
jgi:hypothetical protein